MIPLGPPIPLYVPLFKGKRDNGDNEDEDDGKHGAWRENKDQGGHNSKENFENKDKIKGSYGSKYGGWKIVKRQIQKYCYGKCISFNLFCRWK